MPPQTRRKDSARNRQHIVKVGRDFVDRRQPIALNEIARAAGLGVATVYRHFASTQALLEAVAEPTLESLAETGEKALDGPDAWESLQAFASTVVGAQFDDASLAPVMSAPTDELPRTGELKARIDAVWDALLATANESGAVQSSLSHSDMTPLICGVTYAARVQNPDDSSGPERERAKRYVDLFLTGLRFQDSPSP